MLAPHSGRAQHCSQHTVLKARTATDTEQTHTLCQAITHSLESQMPATRSRSLSRERSPKARHPSRSGSRSPQRRGNSRSPSKSPRRSYSRGRSRSRSRPAAGDWKSTLDKLIDRKYIAEGELDNATMATLEGLPADMADASVARFSEANFARVSNKSGFLMGIIRSVQRDGPEGGSDGFDLLPRAVRHRMDDLIADGRLAKGDIDGRMAKSLSDLPTNLALEAIEKFAVANLDTVRSKTGFLMGIIKRIQQEAYPPRYGGGGYGGGYGAPAYGGGGRYRDDYDRYGGGGGYGDRYGGGHRGYDDRYGGGRPIWWWWLQRSVLRVRRYNVRNHIQLARLFHTKSP
ncbi:hypothetical protein WJX73_008415 [Symbiochloris irregularis]|uniref:Heterogeneous nuclear ribonucleoprotein Q acidic domain-containing protein n=1 Tax=Symbiochloris irregularis TaxID=706552 RepID=A0AAW1PJE7_9CHLO